MITKVTLTRPVYAIGQPSKPYNQIVQLIGKAGVWVGGGEGPAKDYRVGETLTDAQVDELCKYPTLYEVTITT